MTSIPQKLKTAFGSAFRHIYPNSLCNRALSSQLERVALNLLRIRVAIIRSLRTMPLCNALEKFVSGGHFYAAEAMYLTAF